MGKPKVTLIILNWNGLEDTRECLYSLSRLDYPYFDIVVVDNGSTDGSPEVLQREFPSITLIKNTENRGFCEGNNLGISYALKLGTDYVFLLNNDTVVERDSLAKLINVMEKDSGLAAASPKILQYFQPERIYYAGLKISLFWGRGIHRGYNQIDKGQYDTQESTESISGAAVLMRSSALKAVGLLDPIYFAYFEDSDWSLRARRKGYELAYVPQAVIRHKARRTSQGMYGELGMRLITRNRWLFVRKWGSFRHRLFFALSQIVAALTLPFVFALITHKPSLIKAYFSGLYEGMTASLPKRQSLSRPSSTVKRDSKISVIIPCFNEEEGIPVLIHKLSVLEKEDPSGHWEYIFVDDGSSDDTYNLLWNYYQDRRDVKIYRHKKNRGVGAALRTGFDQATGEIIVTIDSDCTYDPSEIPNLLSLLAENTEIATGSPYHPHGECKNVPLVRLFLSKVLSKIYKLILRSNISTYSSIFRAYKRKVIEDIEFESDDFLSVTEILVKAVLKGYQVAELPTTLSVRRYGASKLQVVYMTRRHLKFILKLVLQKEWLKTLLLRLSEIKANSGFFSWGRKKV